MLPCKVCGGYSPYADTQISPDRDFCKCTMRIFSHAEEDLDEGLELLHLQNRQFELQDDVMKLSEKMHCLDSSNPMEHDVDDHLKVPPSLQKGPSKLTHCEKNSISLKRPGVRPGTAPPGGLISEMYLKKEQMFGLPFYVDLQDIREEIAMLHRKFDKELKSMRDVLFGNIGKAIRPIETPKAPPHTEGKENTVPGTILSEAQQALIDATRRRRMFETSVANCERSRAQRNVFDILGHLDEGDNDVLRIRALLDDAVNNLEALQKPQKLVPPKASMLSNRLARLSAPKQFKNASRQPQKHTNQRPLSVPPTSETAMTTSPYRRSTGIAELVDFSTTKTTTAPLMQRPKVILASNTSSKAKLTPSDLREIVDAALKDHLTHQLPPTESVLVQSQLRDVNVGISSQEFMKEEALSPIHSAEKIFLIDRASSPKPTTAPPEIVSRGNSVQSIEKPRTSCSPSITSEVIGVSQKLGSGTQSPILADAEVVSTSVTLPKVEKSAESEEGESLSLTEPHTFSDGVWLDADRSEGEAGGVTVLGAEEVADLARELGPLPSSSETSGLTNSGSEASRGQSEGELTLDQINRHLGAWVAPWRDPLLHLIALNAAGRNSRLPWNQQHKIQKVAQALERRGANQAPAHAEVCCSSTEDLTWVEGMATKVVVTSPPSTPTNGEKSVGEVILPTAVRQQLRRAILAKSSQRMRQRSASLFDGRMMTKPVKTFLSILF
ncbi:unnamed protein product [Hydatigera taeniaeformis]|uniref:Uncharacterized protein n=1 Tax=Hydatigena taeniaeformis TaxID=6205 RepID=A0A0R3X9C2_HYDTA|nr:unnamed protein product [Hydatigera taeniaeformis]